MKTSIKVLNLTKVVKQIEGIKNIDIKPYIERATRTVQTTAKEKVPADTGYLKATIHADTEVKGKMVKGRVWTSTEYAKFVEFGSSGVEGGKNTPHFVPFVDASGNTTGIEKWARRHGIDTTGMKGLVVSGQPQPFMYPAFAMHRKAIEDGLKLFVKTELVKLGKK